MMSNAWILNLNPESGLGPTIGYLSVTEAPRNIESLQLAGEETALFWNLNTENEPRNLLWQATF